MSVVSAQLDKFAYDRASVLVVKVSIVIKAQNDNSKAHASFYETSHTLSFHGVKIAYLNADPFDVPANHSTDLYYPVESSPIPLKPEEGEVIDLFLRRGQVVFDIRGNTRTRWRVGILAQSPNELLEFNLVLSEISLFLDVIRFLKEVIINILPCERNTVGAEDKAVLDKIVDSLTSLANSSNSLGSQAKENNISLKVGEFQETIMDDKCDAKKVLILGVGRVCRPAAELLASIAYGVRNSDNKREERLRNGEAARLRSALPLLNDKLESAGN
ncbi:hypothetical protein RND71_016161 [Anisodus tanguticus]|uniref:Uncharacterized protein n=1 Tax=Anisodus tanguticus TaxID=243964 RepID=A0AAE1S8S9_9SOLA|nr:hypothetical protein RND71_016161 [Anisodus tanguticus]